MQLSPLTDTTAAALNAQIAAVFTNWYNAQGNIYTGRVSAAEREAYNISDNVAPKYLYQNCGRF